MNYLTMSRCIFVLISIVLAGCASTYTNFGDVPPPPATPIRDNLIVSGQRIGPISLGMTAAQLLQALGEPDRVDNYTAGADRRMMQTLWFGSFEVHMPTLNPQRVTSVRTTDGRYATAQGLRVGSSTLSFSGSLGAPGMIRAQNDWCYVSGLEALFDKDGRATALIVQTPGC
jgi:hypothetical protein